MQGDEACRGFAGSLLTRQDHGRACNCATHFRMNVTYFPAVLESYLALQLALI
jgi:hypothetical protein